MDRIELPIACTLGPQDVPGRLEEWRTLLGVHVQSASRIPGGVRLVLDPSASNRLHRLVELEQECCSWIRWSITEDDELIVEATNESEVGAEAVADLLLPS